MQTALSFFTERTRSSATTSSGYLSSSRRAPGVLLHRRHRPLVVRRDPVARPRRDEAPTPRVTATNDEETVARLQPGRVALVDEDHLVLAEELVRVQAREHVRLHVRAVSVRRHHRELALERPDEGPALDHVQGFDDLAARQVVLRVDLIDPHGAEDLHDLPRRGGLARTEDRQLLTEADLMAGLERQVHFVEIRQEHLVLGGSRQVPPHVVRFVAQPALVPQEHGAVRHLPPPIHQRHLVGVDGWLAGRLVARRGALLQADLVPRVDPVRVLELRVVRPQARPLIRVLEVEIAESPERVAPPHDVGVGELPRVGRTPDEDRTRLVSVGDAGVTAPAVRASARDRTSPPSRP